MQKDTRRTIKLTADLISKHMDSDDASCNYVLMQIANMLNELRFERTTD